MNFRNNYFYPLLTAVSAWVITAIISKIKFGDFIELFKLIPAYVWIIFLILIIFWLLVINRNRRSQHANKPKSHPAVYVGASSSETPYMFTLIHFDIKWKIHGWILRDGILPENIEAITPPRCPKCQTEIDEKALLLGGYSWNCPNCSFKKWSRSSFNVLRNSVSKVARRKVEIELEKDKEYYQEKYQQNKKKAEPTGYDSY